MALEYTFTMAKKDCIERHLVGKVTSRWSCWWRCTPP